MPKSDYRKELQLLFDAAESFVEPALGHHRPWAKAMDRARAVLAQPEPVAPTDEEIAKIIFGETYYAFGFDSFPPAWGELEDCLIRQCCVNAARAVLARWGTSANNTSEESFDA
jgi:hypothetical protein